MSTENCKLCNKESTPYVYVNGHICQDCYLDKINDHFLLGFDTAIKLVMKVFEEEGDHQVAICIKESIEEEVERFKKDE